MNWHLAPVRPRQCWHRSLKDEKRIYVFLVYTEDGPGGVGWVSGGAGVRVVPKKKPVYGSYCSCYCMLWGGCESVSCLILFHILKTLWTNHLCWSLASSGYLTSNRAGDARFGQARKTVWNEKMTDVWYLYLTLKTQMFRIVEFCP